VAEFSAGAPVVVKVFADLRKFAPERSEVAVEKDETVDSLVHRLGIPAGKVTVVFLNARHADPQDRIRPGDTVSLFPPVGGG